MNPRITIAVYKPLDGKQAALHQLVLTHHQRLLKLDLVTSREPIIMQSADGTVLEVFEWLSPEAIQAAHSHPEVLAMWSEFGAVCTFFTTNAVPEINNMFSEFTPLD